MGRRKQLLWLEDVGATGDKAKQPCEISGKWPVSLIGLRAAGEGLEMPSRVCVCADLQVALTPVCISGALKLQLRFTSASEPGVSCSC